MRTIKLNIPDNLDLKDYDFLMILAAKLYENSKLTLGEAASMVGVSVFSGSVSDLYSGIASA